MIDKSAEIKNPSLASLTNENWYGALYYDILINKKEGKTFYTLLGWDGNNDFTNKKIIEALYFTKSGKPRFSAPVFERNGKKMKRIIFEYSKMASMLLRYDKKYKMIVFDQLVPSEKKYEGQYAYYGPNFLHDAMEYDKKKWVFVTNVEVKNPKRKASNKQIKYGY